MPTDEEMARAEENTSRIQRMLDDAARDAGPGGLPKNGIYHGTALIKKIGGKPLEGSGFEDQPAEVESKIRPQSSIVLRESASRSGPRRMSAFVSIRFATIKPPSRVTRADSTTA
jgi:hypothetical protein